ncbi:MAG: thioredoxin family protein [Finegoldia sp.]|nr:thioredoxin family protein [Finegoldia sp.]
MKKLLSVLALLLVLTGCASKDFTQIKNEEDYEKVLNDKDGLIYFGADYCPYCKVFKPILLDASKASNKKVYYFDTEYDKDSKFYKKMMDDYEIKSIPKLFKLEKGKVTGSIDDESSPIKVKEFVEEK